MHVWKGQHQVRTVLLPSMHHTIHLHSLFLLIPAVEPSSIFIKLGITQHHRREHAFHNEFAQ